MFGDIIRKVIPFWSTTVARLSTTAIILSPTLLTYPTLNCILSWLLLYAGLLFGWSAWQNMTNIPKDIASMSVRGLVLTGLAGLSLGSVPIALSGAFLGPLYYVGKFLPQTTELDGSPTSNSTWGEYLFGAVLGLSIILSI